MSRTLKSRTRRLEQASAAGRETRCLPIIRATDLADADQQVEALVTSGALEGWNELSFPIVRVIAPKWNGPEGAG
jgi:hypothetical protein